MDYTKQSKQIQILNAESFPIWSRIRRSPSGLLTNCFFVCIYQGSNPTVDEASPHISLEGGTYRKLAHSCLPLVRYQILQQGALDLDTRCPKNASQQACITIGRICGRYSDIKFTVIPERETATEYWLTNGFLRKMKAQFWVPQLKNDCQVIF